MMRMPSHGRGKASGRGFLAILGVEVGFPRRAGGVSPLSSRSDRGLTPPLARGRVQKTVARCLEKGTDSGESTLLPNQPHSNPFAGAERHLQVERTPHVLLRVGIHVVEDRLRVGD